MSNTEHLAILRQGLNKWNEWRSLAGWSVWPDLSGEDLTQEVLTGANLSRTNLADANLENARLDNADLRQADLSRAHLRRADLKFARLEQAVLERADLSGADLHEAHLSGARLVEAILRHSMLPGAVLKAANLYRADLTGAYLVEANLSAAKLQQTKCLNANFERAVFIHTNLEGADLTGARVYGISAWDLQLTNAVQQDLEITRSNSNGVITVDDLEVAQFMYLLLNNDRVRKVIDTVTSKVVLILGRFTPERKHVLDGVRDELRKRDLLPVVFDFKKPSHRDLTETVSTLAHMAKFVVADLTDPRSLPQELATVVPALPSVPVQPILLASEQEWSMYEHFSRFDWVLPIVKYVPEEPLASLVDRVIGPVDRWLAGRKTGNSNQLS